MWKTSLAAIGLLLGQLLFFFALMTVADMGRAGVIPQIPQSGQIFWLVILCGTSFCGLAGGIIGYRTGRVRDNRDSPTPRANRWSFMPLTDSRPIAVPTFSLVAYLITVFAWEVEVVVLLVHLFTKNRLDPLGHGTLLATSISLTLLSWLWGKREFKRLKSTRGRIPITRGQAWVIAPVLVGLGFLFGFIAMRLFEH